MKQIQLRLLSDATFGRGDGVPGIVDDEIDHDSETGLPFIKGRTIKGLVVEECSNILYSVAQWNPSFLKRMEMSAQRLFGSPGSRKDDEGRLHFGEANVDESIGDRIRQIVRASSPIVSAAEVLNSLTGIRRRSAMNEETEAPADETLRSARVLMRDTVFFCRLVEVSPLHEEDWRLLAAAVAGIRRGGKNRNRGAGRLECSLLDDGANQGTTLASFFEQLKTVEAVV